MSQEFFNQNGIKVTMDTHVMADSVNMRVYLHGLDLSEQAEEKAIEILKDIFKAERKKMSAIGR